MRLPPDHAAAHALASRSWRSLADALPPRESNAITYSRKVFIPLTRLCRDSCGYCTFAHHTGTPEGESAYLTPEEVLDIARSGAAAGCTEALFTLGDAPERRWSSAADELSDLGYGSTVDYLAAMAGRVLEETGLLPHTNPGIVNAREMAKLRDVSVSQGLMLEGLSPHLHAPGGPHAGCSTKLPAARLRTLALAGRLRVPFTTGLLLGLGETRHDTIDALLRIRHMHRRFGHVQEVILQPFRPKPGTRLAGGEAFSEDELLWAVATAKHLFSTEGIAVQTPPNLSPGKRRLCSLLACGVDDFGGVSPGVTRDWVNPEASWPEVRNLRAAVEAESLTLVPRLPAYPRYVAHPLVGSRALSQWQSTPLHAAVRRLSDAEGYARSERPAMFQWHAGLPMARAPSATADEDEDERWLPSGQEYERVAKAVAEAAEQAQTAAGETTLPKQTVEETAEETVEEMAAVAADEVPAQQPIDEAIDEALIMAATSAPVRAALRVALSGTADLSRRQVVTLLTARGADVSAVCLAADTLRRRRVGAGVSYCVCRNINYTNRCEYSCAFCAFSKGSQQAKGAAYEVEHTEVSRRAAEAWARGATEVCMQGGIHPRFTGDSYLAFLAAAHEGAPGIHVHAFSPLEVAQGAATRGEPLSAFLSALRAAGLGSLPGTAAEVLCDPVRREICADKLTTNGWLRTVRAAHMAALPTTSTLMFGHCEGVRALAHHLVRLRQLQTRSMREGQAAAITEFVPLPFVHPEAPIFRRGGARPGPTLREAVLVHSVARLALPNVPSIQTSWTKMGQRGAAMALRAGANDLGGTLMNERISRAAGAAHGQEMSPAQLRAIALGLNDESGGGGGEGKGGGGGSAAERRYAWQRTTLYEAASAERQEAAEAAPPLLGIEERTQRPVSEKAIPT